MMNVSQTSHIDLIKTDIVSAVTTAVDNQVSRTGQLIIGIIVSMIDVVRRTNRLPMGFLGLFNHHFAQCHRKCHRSYSHMACATTTTSYEFHPNVTGDC